MPQGGAIARAFCRIGSFKALPYFPQLALTGAVWIMLAAPATAQQQQVRDLVVGARLGAGYAGLLNLAATPDISAASYHVTDPNLATDIDVLRVPYEDRLATLSTKADLYWRVVGSYLTSSQDFPMSIPPFAPGSIDSKWTAYSLTGGLFAKIDLGSGFTLAPGLDLSVARLENSADYMGGATLLQPFLDNLLFNWHTNAYLVTPNLGLTWKLVEADRRVSVGAHVSWSWISSFEASDPAIGFNETMGVYSIRADYAAPTGMTVFQRPLDWVVLASYAGFFGGNRHALGFTSVAEIGAGVEIPISKSSLNPKRVRISASYLFGDHVTGWTVSLGLRY